MQTTAPVSATTANVGFAWLELTHKCQLSCPLHCYVEAGPSKGHGEMQLSDWQRVIRELTELGVREVQFIGGEPTLHPHFAELVMYALELRLGVEIFSNLARRIPPWLWELFSLPGIRLATSYYSSRPEIHDRITGVRGSNTRTRSSLEEIVRREIPVRVGIIGILEEQCVEEATDQLVALGISRERIGYDKLREVGRGVRNTGPGPDQLCGRCASREDGVLAISSSGAVWPCVFSRWLEVGNVLYTPLREIISSGALSQIREDLGKALGNPTPDGCAPDVCGPKFGCAPATCRPPD